ncbi:hypothetical protein [Neoroseomonas soli]|uniref:DUF2474 family protein n=1 Tax=Neoroseomonas soli TaxID=1081025 RepID=A0A9X9WXH7_9PROT|nr:hypothetical protein [Neoroseomonas soli]MBR0671856.1 hypothetical protein [Neoroseomonas soli]
MSDPRNAPLPARTPALPLLVTRGLGFFLLAGTMWIAGMLALIRSAMAVFGS